VVKGPREPSPSGSAENDLPPASLFRHSCACHRHPAAPRLRRRTHRHPMPTNSSLAVQTHGGCIPAQARDDRGELGTFLTPKPHPRPPNINHLTPRSSPSPKPVPTLPLSRRGYTRRRPGEARPALVVKGRREPSSSGSAENGLPPARRGKQMVSDRPPASDARKSAPGVPVRHTGGSTGMVSPDLQVRRDAGARSLGTRETGGQTPPHSTLQRDRSRGQKPPNGALRGAT
jgi:hypothetical protein